MAHRHCVALNQVNPMLSLLRQIEGSLHDISIHQSNSKSENGKSKSPPRSSRKNSQSESKFDQMVENHAEEWNGLQELHLLALNWRYLLENSRESSASSYDDSSQNSKSDISSQKTAQLRKQYCDAISRSRALTIVFRKIVEDPELAKQLFTNYKNHHDQSKTDINSCKTVAYAADSDCLPSLENVQSETSEDSEIILAEESSLLAPESLDPSKEKAGTVDSVAESLRECMMLIGIDIEYQTMKSLLSLLYHIAEQRQLAKEILNEIESQRKAVSSLSMPTGTDEILALSDRLDALIDSAINIAISVLRPQSEAHDLSLIQRLFKSLCSPMRELVALWDRLAFESEPAGGSSSEDGEEETTRNSFPHLSSMALKIGDQSLRLAKKLEAEAQTRKEDGAQTSSSMMLALSNMKTKLHDTLQSARQQLLDIAGHYQDKVKSLEQEQKEQSRLRQTLDSERDAIIERRAKLLEELATLDEKLESTEDRIRTVVLAEESIAKKTHELGSALDAVNKLEESQEKCSTTCDALWKSSSDVVGLFHKNFIQVSDRAIQSGISAVESTLSMKCHAISSKAILLQSEIEVQTERSKHYAGQVISRSRSFGMELSDGVDLEENEDELRHMTDSKQEYTRTQSKLLVAEKDLQMMSSELQTIESDACQSLPDHERLRTQCANAHEELLRAQAMLKESKRDYESTLNQLITG